MPDPSPAPKLKVHVLLEVGDVAELMQCTTRHIWRMVSAGRFPAPISIGGLRRWRQDEIRQWIAAGCPATPQKGTQS